MTPLKITLKERMKLITGSLVSIGLLILIYYLITVFILSIIITYISRIPETPIYFEVLSMIFVVLVTFVVLSNLFLSRKLKKLIVEEEKTKKREEIFK